MIAANHLRGDFPLASWEALAATPAQVVDVRSATEFATGHIPGAINMPLDEQRGRLGELSPTREIWVVCGVGQQGVLRHARPHATRLPRAEPLRGNANQPFPLSLQAQCSQGQLHWPFVNLDAKIPPDVHVLIFS